MCHSLTIRIVLQLCTAISMDTDLFLFLELINKHIQSLGNGKQGLSVINLPVQTFSNLGMQLNPEIEQVFAALSSSTKRRRRTIGHHVHSLVICFQRILNLIKDQKIVSARAGDLGQSKSILPYQAHVTVLAH